MTDPLDDPVIQLLLNHDRVDDWGVMEEDELKEYVDLARAIRRQVSIEITNNIDHNNDRPENAEWPEAWHDGMTFAGDLAWGAGWWTQEQIDDIKARAEARYRGLQGLID